MDKEKQTNIEEEGTSTTDASLNTAEQTEQDDKGGENTRIPYERFKQKVEVVNYNKSLVEKEPTYAVEFDREIKALNKFIDDVLIRQLESLNTDLASNGETVILEEYPNLKEIVSSREEILNEVITWKKTFQK